MYISIREQNIRALEIVWAWYCPNGEECKNIRLEIGYTTQTGTSKENKFFLEITMIIKAARLKKGQSDINAEGRSLGTREQDTTSSGTAWLNPKATIRKDKRTWWVVKISWSADFSIWWKWCGGGVYSSNEHNHGD